MKIKKAIEVLTDFRRQESNLLGNEFAEATALGIEALKWRQHCEAVGYVETCDPLPGETKT